LAVDVLAYGYIALFTKSISYNVLQFETPHAEHPV